MRELGQVEMQDRICHLMRRYVTYCDDHGLTYYIAFGSLLGTVRHKGFIPWDNDNFLQYYDILYN